MDLNILRHLIVLAEEVVDLLDAGAGAGGDAFAAAAVDEVGVAALLVGHGVDDGFDAAELGLVDVFGGLGHALEGADGGEHLEDGLHGAHLFDLTELFAEVFEGEAGSGEGFFGELLGLTPVEFFFGAFEQGGDVAHAHDAGDDAVGVEGLEGVGLFAGAEELDGCAGDLADGEGGTAAGVAVHFGEDGAGDGEEVVEGLGGVDGVLAGHGVGDEEDFGGREELFELGHLVHEGLVDAEAAGGVDDEDVAAEVGGFAFSFAGEAEDFGGAVRCGSVELAFVEVDAGGFGDDGELLAGGGAVDVDRDEHGAVAALFEPLGELGGGGGFAASLQPGHEDDAGGLGGGLEPGDVFAEEGDELVVDDFDDLLGGAEGGGDLGAEGFDADVGDEVVGDGEVDVGFEEGEADLAEGVGDVFFGDGALAAEGLEGTLELFGEVFKHGYRKYSGGKYAAGFVAEVVQGAGRAAEREDNSAMQKKARPRLITRGLGDSNAALVKEYEQYLVVEKGLRPNSVIGYKTDLEQFAEQLEDRHAVLTTATQQDVHDFIEHLLAHGVDRGSVRRKLTALRGFYRWMLLDSRIAKDPTLNVETPSSWKILPKSLAESEVRVLLEQAGEAANAEGAKAIKLRNHALLELLYAGGLRASEICDLKVEDVKLDEQRAQVRGKGDKERIVPLGRAACEAIETYLHRRDGQR